MHKLLVKGNKLHLLTFANYNILCISRNILKMNNFQVISEIIKVYER